MEYHEAAEFLFGLRRFRPKPGTESTARLLSHLEDPQDDVSFVQIAGSNGKGSTARMVERTLREAGLSVGLYTSPHLEDLRERIRVDGRKIPRSSVRSFVAEIRDYVTERAADGEAPTFFEVLTAMAIREFDRADVDVAVLEVGIGGRYDATSVVDPVASAVTTVTLEHTDILGDTEAEIARDKAHVAPADAPLITGASGEALEGVREVAGEVVTVGFGDREGAEPDVSVAYEGRVNHTEAVVSIDDGDPLEARIPLLGRHQAGNAGIAATLARQVADVSDEALRRGLRSAHWPGRFEVLETEPLVVLDGAHNPGACEGLAETLAEYDYDDLTLVTGVMHDKDVEGIAAALPTPDTTIATEPALDRAEDGDVLARVFERAGVPDVRVVPNVRNALETAIADSGDGDCVLVTGSLFAVAEARSRWTDLQIPKRVRDREDAREVLAGAHATESDVAAATDAAVHRVVKTSLRDDQARTLRTELCRLGGECALSGLRPTDERIDAVLTGTLEQFETLVARLADRSDGLAAIGRELASTLELEDGAGEPDGASSGDGPAPPWADRTAVMGILNVTPDSFHDGGEYDVLEDAVARAETMVEVGADIVDVGGESTRPGADPVPVAEEIDRVVPVIEALADLDALLSIDTRKAAVADAALEAGADIVNDVSGLEDPEMRFVVADHDATLIVMHSVDAPVVPDREVEYDDVVEDVIDQLRERILLAEKAGLDRGDIVVDPGIGFAKSARESFALLDRLGEFRALGCPILFGHSHKSMFEHVGREAGERLETTVAATALATDRGADIVRVHDVDENVAAVRTALAARDPDRFEW